MPRSPCPSATHAPSPMPSRRLLDDEPRRLALAREAQARAIAIDADYTAASFERLYAEMLAQRGRAVQAT